MSETTIQKQIMWVPVKGHPNYQISNNGLPGSEGENFRIRRKTKKGNWRYSNGTINERGYRIFMLDGKCKKFHRLVLESFGIAKPKGRMLQSNHIDHDKDNNTPENLEWVTPQQNIDHLFKKKGKPYHNKPVRKNQDIYEYLEYHNNIVKLIDEGKSRREIKAITGYSLDTVENVRRAYLRGLYKFMYWNCYRQKIGLPTMYKGYYSGEENE